MSEQREKNMQSVRLPAPVVSEKAQFQVSMPPFLEFESVYGPPPPLSILIICMLSTEKKRYERALLALERIHLSSKSRLLVVGTRSSKEQNVIMLHIENKNRVPVDGTIANGM